MLLQPQPHIPDTLAGEVAGLGVGISIGADRADIVLAAPALQWTADECRQVAALLLEAAAALMLIPAGLGAAVPPDRGFAAQSCQRCGLD